MEETLKYLTNRINELEDHISGLLNTNFGLRHTNKLLKDNIKEIQKLIKEDYFEDGSFENYYKVLELLEECLKGDKK